MKKQSILYILMLLSIFLIMITSSIETNDLEITSKGPSWTIPAYADVHQPINFGSDSELEGFVNKTGTGVISDPYIIQNLAINATGGHGINVSNTRAFLIIQNCFICCATSPYSGIILKNTTNVVLYNNTIISNYNGITVQSCNDTFVRENNITLNTGSGIYFELNSKNNTVEYNNITKNSIHGIYIDTCQNNSFYQNQLVDNSERGINLWGASTENIVSKNNITLNHQGGIILTTGNNNFILENDVNRNYLYGIYVNVAHNNTVYGNTIFKNDNTGLYLVSSTNNSIILNNVSNNTNQGINAHTNSHNNSIFQNNIHNNTGDGVRISGGADQNRIFANNITYNVGRGIRIESACIQHEIWQNFVFRNQNGIYLSGSSENAIYLNTISNNTGQGIYLELSSHYNSIYNNIIVNQTTNGIYITSSSYNCIYSNDISNNTQNGLNLFTSIYNNITFNNIHYNRLSGLTLSTSASHNTIDQCNITRSQYGIYTVIGSSNNTITQNNISANTNHGIYISAGDNNTIQFNNCTKNTQNGIYLTNSNNNTISQNNCSFNSQSGIYLTPSSNNTIFQNSICNNSQYGMYLNTNSNNNTISMNSCSFNGYGGTTYAGIYLTGSSNNILDHNNFTSNRYYGIYLYLNANNNSIMANNVSRNTQHGVYVYTCLNNTFLSNVISYNTQYGMYFRINSHNNTVIGNDISKNLYDGLLLGTSSSITIIDNNITANYYSGIYLSNSHFNIIQRNNISANQNENTAAAGIQLSSSNGNQILNNILHFNEQYGLSFNSASYNTIINNSIINASYTGIYIENSATYNNFTSNEISHTYVSSYTDLTGIWIDTSSSNFFHNNTLIDNNRGFYLEDSHGIQIIGNNITMNQGTYGTGITLINADSCIIAQNNISYNAQYGISIDDETGSYQIYLNYIANNSFGMVTGTDIGDYLYFNVYWNYWGDYTIRYPTATQLHGVWQTRYQLNISDVFDYYPLSIYQNMPLNVPIAPTFTVFSNNTWESSTTISWTAIAGATGYQLYVNGLRNITTTSTSLLFEFPEYGHYWFWVTTINGSGESRQSTPIEIIYANLNLDTVIFKSDWTLSPFWSEGYGNMHTAKIWRDGNYLYTVSSDINTNYYAYQQITLGRNILLAKWDLNGNLLLNVSWNNIAYNAVGGFDIEGNSEYLFVIGRSYNPNTENECTLFLKVDKSTLNVIYHKVFPGTIQCGGKQLTIVGSYAYSAGYIMDRKYEIHLIKWRLSDGNIEASQIWSKTEYSGAHSNSIWSDGTFLYLGGYLQNISQNGIILKFNLSDLSFVWEKIFPITDWGDQVHCIIGYGSWLYGLVDLDQITTLVKLYLTNGTVAQTVPLECLGKFYAAERIGTQLFFVGRIGREEPESRGTYTYFPGFVRISLSGEIIQQRYFELSGGFTDIAVNGTMLYMPLVDIKSYSGYNYALSLDLVGYRTDIVLILPSAPTITTINQTTQISWLIVQWNAVPEASEYWIYLDYIYLASTTNTNYNISFSVGNHLIVVRSTNMNGSSGASNVLSVSYIVLTIPQPPTITTTNQTIQVRWIVIEWTAISGATEYHIYVNNTFFANTTSTSFNFTITQSGTYLIMIRAVNALGNSTDSNILTIIVILPNEGTPNLPLIITGSIVGSAAGIAIVEAANPSNLQKLKKRIRKNETPSDGHSPVDPSLQPPTTIPTEPPVIFSPADTTLIQQQLVTLNTAPTMVNSTNLFEVVAKVWDQLPTDVKDFITKLVDKYMKFADQANLAVLQSFKALSDNYLAALKNFRAGQLKEVVSKLSEISTKAKETKFMDLHKEAIDTQNEIARKLGENN